MQPRTGLDQGGQAAGPFARFGLARLAAGPLGALGIRLMAAALAYALQIVLARLLGTADYGTFSFAWNIVTIGGFLATLGFGQIAVRFLAEYHEQNAPGLARGFVRESLLMTLFGSLLIVAGTYALFPIVERGYGPLCCTVLLIGLLALPFFALTDVIEGFARSQGWIFRALAPAYIGRTGLLLAGLIGFAALGLPLDARRAMELALAATIGAMIWQIGWTMPALARLFPKASATRDSPVWRAAAAPTLLADLALLARQSIDLILLGLLASPAVVGIYFAATRIASLIGLVEFAIGATYGHRFARANLAGPDERLARFHEARRMMQRTGFAAAVALAIATPLILSLFGPTFHDGLVPALILLGAAGLRMAAGPIEDLLTLCGFAAAVWRANLIGTLVTAIGCLVLAGSLGAVGAAIGASLGNLAATTMLVLAYRRHLGPAQVA